jgi:hypothetical protein
MAPLDMTFRQKKKLVVKAMDYQLFAGSLYKLGVDGILRHYVVKHEIPPILEESLDIMTSRHYVGKNTVQKILRIGICWPTLHKDAKEYYQKCDVC